MIAMLVTFWNVDVTYGAENVDVTLYVHGNATGGPILNSQGNIADGQWAPGVTKSGTIRIINNYSSRIKVSNLGLNVKLFKGTPEALEEIQDRNLTETFAKNMKLNIKKGRLLIFNQTIYDKSFYEMLYEKGSQVYTGFNIPPIDSFNLGKSDHVDLLYSVSMDTAAGNELQGVTAKVSFLINTEENPEHVQINNYGSSSTPKPSSPPDTVNHWAHDCIETLTSKGIINGYPDGTMRPENFITRAEVAVTVSKALKLSIKDEGKNPYSDALPDWAKGSILANWDKKVFEGYPDRSFKANQYITREEMTKVLVNAFEKKLTMDIEIKFKDKDSVSKWAIQYVKTAIQNGAVDGYEDNTFRAQNKITRAEAFTLICKLLGYHNEHKQ